MNKFFTTEENKKLEEKVWQEFLGKIKQVVSSKNIGEVLEILLSSYEKKELARRLAIISLLNEAKTYRKISEILGVSHQTIGAVKKCVLKNSSKFYSSYRRKEKKINPLPGVSFIDNLAKILSKTPKYRYISRGGRWQFLNM